MPKAHLTDITIRNLKPRPSQVTYWDETLPSFGCRVSPGGTKTFTVMYGDTRRRVTIGRYPTLSLSKARTKAKELLAEITLGKHGTSIAFDRALELFVTTHCKVNNKARTAYETERLLNKRFLPIFKQRLLEDISTDDITSVVDKLLATPSECNHAFTAIRTFFRWAQRRKYVTHSPCDGMRLPTKPVARTRVLSDEELPSIFRASEQLGTYGVIVKLLVLTGQRLNEIAKLRREYVDVEQRLITLPPTLTKNNRQHTFPFGSMAYQIFATLPEEGLLFPTHKNANVPFNNWSDSKHTLDQLCPIEPWTLHDLRRTFATNLAALNVPLHVVEKLLNHVSGSISGVAAIYNRYAYEAEMRDAVAAWEKRLDFLVKSART